MPETLLGAIQQFLDYAFSHGPVAGGLLVYFVGAFVLIMAAYVLTLLYIPVAFAFPLLPGGGLVNASIRSYSEIDHEMGKVEFYLSIPLVMATVCAASAFVNSVRKQNKKDRGEAR